MLPDNPVLNNVGCLPPCLVLYYMNSLCCLSGLSNSSSSNPSLPDSDPKGHHLHTDCHSLTYWERLFCCIVS